MNTKSTSLLLAALLACVAYLPSETVLAADEHSGHQSDAAAPAAPGKHGMADMQKLREQMAAIRAAKDPAARAKLMEEHLQAMEAAMQSMEKSQGCMMMRGGHGGQ